jgi:hypothetical protein
MDDSPDGDLVGPLVVHARERAINGNKSVQAKGVIDFLGAMGLK